LTVTDATMAALAIHCVLGAAFVAPARHIATPRTSATPLMTVAAPFTFGPDSAISYGEDYGMGYGNSRYNMRRYNNGGGYGGMGRYDGMGYGNDRLTMRMGRVGYGNNMYGYNSPQYSNVGMYTQQYNGGYGMMGRSYSAEDRLYNRYNGGMQGPYRNNYGYGYSNGGGYGYGVGGRYDLTARLGLAGTSGYNNWGGSPQYSSSQYSSYGSRYSY